MPPAQAQALIKSRPFSDDRHPALDLAFVALSLSIIFLSGSILACVLFVRCRRSIHSHATRRTIFGLPALQSRGVWRGRRRTTFSPTVSVLIARSTIVASSILNLDVLPILRRPSAHDRSMDFPFRCVERCLFWGRATVGLLSFATSASAASIRQLFARPIGLIASSPTASSNNDGPHHCRTGSQLCIPRRLCSTRVFTIFGGMCGQPIDSISKEHAESRQLFSGLSQPAREKDRLGQDTSIADTINVLLPTGEAQFKAEIPVNPPLIILSLPSIEHLVEDASPPASLNEDLLNPDGTFRSTARPRVLVDIHNISDATRLALVSRLQERRKRPASLHSPNLLSTPSIHWPRWL
ncbi:hypothetical protein F5148DRAFT_147669 [Russula earlei]|uniref:Uncharacterized protein n=1 Tax=Russula earlei TaxID=71964 RepID=A0ACC0U6F2_9AGAM|nr:hypothetical protein F5148DRAFT_147669 [Russula earlei]